MGWWSGANWSAISLGPLPQRGAPALPDAESCDERERLLIRAINFEEGIVASRADRLEAWQRAFEGPRPSPPDHYPAQDEMVEALEEITTRHSELIVDHGPLDCSEYPCMGWWYMPLEHNAEAPTVEQVARLQSIIGTDPALHGLKVGLAFRQDQVTGMSVVTFTLHGEATTPADLAYAALTAERRENGLRRLAASHKQARRR